MPSTVFGSTGPSGLKTTSKWSQSGVMQTADGRCGRLDVDGRRDVVYDAPPRPGDFVACAISDRDLKVDVAPRVAREPPDEVRGKDAVVGREDLGGSCYERLLGRRSRGTDAARE